MEYHSNSKWKGNVLNDIPEIIFRLDQQSRLIDYHAPGEGELSLPPNVFLGKKLDSVGLPREFIRHNQELIDLAMETGLIQKKEYVLESTEGKRFLETRVVPINKHEIIDIVSDVTERKITRMNLVEADRDKSAILNSMSDLFLFYDPDLKIRWASKAAAEYIGQPLDKLNGAYCYQIWHGSDYPCENCPVLKAKETGTPQTLEKQTKDGKVWLMKGYPVFNDEGQIIGMTELGQDISFQRKFQEELELSKQKAEMISQFKSEFLSNLSHEIRTPLNVIIGFADLLENAIFDTKHKEYIESIKASSNNIVMLIDDILDISRIEAGRLNLQFKSVSLFEVIKDIKQMFAMKVSRKGLEFITEVDPEIPKFLILDEIRIKQILTNLVSNAIKYTDEGHIKVKIEQIEKRSVLGSEELDLRILVEDTGLGIPETEMNFVFEPFTQVKTRKSRGSRGHGLGLAITKSIVELMEGRISVESKVGSGTSFIIEIPEVVVHTFSLGYSHKAEYPEVSLKGKTVLLVDDSEINRKLVRENLENAGVKIVEAEDGEMAISIADKIKPDLILMDILMPRMDGFEATSIIRGMSDLKDIPVIALTALAMKEDVERIEKAGFDEYLLKPFHISELFEKVGMVFKEEAEKDELPSDDLMGINETDYESSSIEYAYKQLNDKLLPKWNEVKVNREFKLISDFAENIAELGNESGIDFIQRFGLCLQAYSNDFDVENIDVCLNTFPKILEKIKLLNDGA